MFRPFPNLAPLADAEAALRRLLPRLGDVELVPVDEAAGRVLAADVAAPADVPAFDRSAMDGYAVRAADVAVASKQAPVVLPVVAEAHAGDPRRAIRPGEAAQIATGGVLPDGADAVVMAEQTARDGAAVRILAPVAPGSHVSVRGGDFRAGDRILRAGRRLDAAGVSLAASLGVATLPVVRRPRVAILPSGTEVVEPGRPLREGEVYDSNSRALATLVARLGGIPDRRPPMRDTPEDHRAALDEAAKGADLVVVTGGTSVGERDLLAPLVAAHGEVLVHGLRLRPGKPVLVGAWRGTPLLGLPGYPASTLVTAELLLAPALRAALGEPAPRGPHPRATWGHDVEVRSDLTTVVPVRVADGVAASTYKESGTLTSVVDADGYALFSEGSTGARKGESLEVRRWSWA